ncbi:hypothetical protein LQU94_02030 [Peptoniphilus sp. KCTC 25270]|uniref:hypothetical protein n=1 Tax=Peptoniphilus sp. KCTC 25270 TaxID=2897414 RepID=UPI001E2E96B4|nr:hypothetical protein [Peptoniphilus sp. KCTC 25270]MCD1146892.1 hypothetical protein [Peptoniphilus sp. KCTC 25270]
MKKIGIVLSLFSLLLMTSCNNEETGFESDFIKRDDVEIISESEWLDEDVIKSVGMKKMVIEGDYNKDGKEDNFNGWALIALQDAYKNGLKPPSLVEGTLGTMELENESDYDVLSYIFTLKNNKKQEYSVRTDDIVPRKTTELLLNKDITGIIDFEFPQESNFNEISMTQNEEFIIYGTHHLPHYDYGMYRDSHFAKGKIYGVKILTEINENGDRHNKLKTMQLKIKNTEN